MCGRKLTPRYSALEHAAHPHFMLHFTLQCGQVPVFHSARQSLASTCTSTCVSKFYAYQLMFSSTSSSQRVVQSSDQTWLSSSACPEISSCCECVPQTFPRIRVAGIQCSNCWYTHCSFRLHICCVRRQSGVPYLSACIVAIKGEKSHHWAHLWAVIYVLWDLNRWLHHSLTHSPHRKMEINSICPRGYCYFAGYVSYCAVPDT